MTTRERAPIRCGQRVRVIAGPHCDTTGFVDHLDPEEPRALLNLGHSKMMWVDLKSLWRD